MRTVSRVSSDSSNFFSVSMTLVSQRKVRCTGKDCREWRRVKRGEIKARSLGRRSKAVWPTRRVQLASCKDIDVTREEIVEGWSGGGWRTVGG